MRRNPFLLIPVLLLAAAATQARGAEGAPGAPPGSALFRLPVTGPAAPAEGLEPLGPERELELRGLAGEVIVARLGLESAAPAVPEARATFEGEEKAWERLITFLPGAAAGGGGLRTLWLTVAVPRDAEPGVHEGYLEVRTGQTAVRVPLIITIGAGRLEPTAARYLLLTPAPKANPAPRPPLPYPLPPAWPQSLPLTFNHLEERTGDLDFDPSELEPLIEGLAPGEREEALPVFLGPLMERLTQRFGLQPLSGTYVLALHGLLCRLRDWAAERGLRLLFVPPAGDAGADPDGLALQQHLIILRETPGIQVLLPVRPVLKLKRSQQQTLLGLAQAYLVESPKGLNLVEKRGVEGRPVWLHLSVHRRLAAGFWACSVGASGVLLEGEGSLDSVLAALAAETDARYLDTLQRLIDRAEAAGEPSARRSARLARNLLEKLGRQVERLLTDPKADPSALGREAASWRESLRHEIETLTDALR